MDEVVDVVDDITNNNNKKARLPNVNKLTYNIEFEGVRCDALESVFISGIVHEYSEVKDASTKAWYELFTEWWDKESGLFKGYEPPKGHKRLFYNEKGHILLS